MAYDLLGDELLAAKFAFMIEENRRCRPKTVVFAVGSYELISQFLGKSVWTLRAWRRGLALLSLQQIAEHLRAAGKQKARLRRMVANGSSDIGQTVNVSFNGLSRMLDASGDRALSGEVIDFVELVLLYERFDSRFVGNVSVVDFNLAPNGFGEKLQRAIPRRFFRPKEAVNVAILSLKQLS